MYCDSVQRHFNAMFHATRLIVAPDRVVNANAGAGEYEQDADNAKHLEGGRSQNQKYAVLPETNNFKV
jgi:hypothetical protein